MDDLATSLITSMYSAVGLVAINRNNQIDSCQSDRLRNGGVSKRKWEDSIKEGRG
jgi:hypothetical protein